MVSETVLSAREASQGHEILPSCIATTKAPMILIYCYGDIPIEEDFFDKS